MRPRLGCVALSIHPGRILFMQKLFLLVEDSTDDAFIFKRSVQDAGLSNPIHWVESGAEAVTYLTGEGRYRNRDAFPFPSVLFLDLSLKDVTGLDILTTVRASYLTEELLIVVLSGTDDPADVRAASELSADAFMPKPIRPQDLTNLAAQFSSHF